MNLTMFYMKFLASDDLQNMLPKSGLYMVGHLYISWAVLEHKL